MVAESVVSTQSTNLRAYPGGFINVLVSPEQTEGSLAVFEMTTGPGAEPPRHVHTREDEVFHVVEGEVRFQIGDEVLVAGPGQTVFAPRNIPHQFNILGERAKVLTMLTPGDFINYFLDWSTPVNEEPVTIEIPQGPPPADILATWVKLLDERYGVHFV